MLSYLLLFFDLNTGRDCVQISLSLFVRNQHDDGKDEAQGIPQHYGGVEHELGEEAFEERQQRPTGVDAVEIQQLLVFDVADAPYRLKPYQKWPYEDEIQNFYQRLKDGCSYFWQIFHAVWVSDIVC